MMSESDHEGKMPEEKEERERQEAAARLKGFSRPASERQPYPPRKKPSFWAIMDLRERTKKKPRPKRPDRWEDGRPD